MHIRITRRVFEKLTDDELTSIRRTVHDLRNQGAVDVDLGRLDDLRFGQLRDALTRLREDKVRGVGALVNDMDLWERIVTGDASPGSHRPRTLRQFAELASQYIQGSPGHRLYQQRAGSRWSAYYCNYIRYHPPENPSGGVRHVPAWTEIDCMYWTLGKQVSHRFSFHARDTDGMTVAQALAEGGLVLETDELRAQYLELRERHQEVVPLVGGSFRPRDSRISWVIAGWTRTAWR